MQGGSNQHAQSTKLIKREEHFCICCTQATDISVGVIDARHALGFQQLCIYSIFVLSNA